MSYAPVRVDFVPREKGDFCALPEEDVVIHPAMSPRMGGALVRACEKLQLSQWDREKVYQVMSSLQPQPRA